MNSFLKRYRVRLTTDGPVFIGSGSVVTKKGYLTVGNKIAIVDLGKFYELATTAGKADEFERFVGSTQVGDLMSWLKRNTNFDPREAFQYMLNISELTEEFNEIQQFVKNAFTEPYIPGSSLKGAMRTLILGELYRGSSPQVQGIIQQLLQTGSNTRRPQEALGIEKNLLSKLDGDNPQTRDIMRAVVVGDSKPLKKDDLIICQKIDQRRTAKKDSNGSKENALPTYRECLKPGVVVEFDLTINQKLLENTGVNIDKHFLQTAIENAYSNYTKYSSNFEPPVSPSADSKSTIYLGGGSGFYSKTLLMPILDNQTANELTKMILAQQFSKHNHDKAKISPQALKLTKYDGKYWEMGRCKLEIEEIR
jgi:CRISPR type III-A-associated RAMP protein Csm5